MLTDQRFGDIISQKTMSGPIRLLTSVLRRHNPSDDFRCRVLSRVDVCTRKVRISATTLAGYDASKVVRETTIEQYERVTRVRHERAVDPKWTTSRLDLTS